MNRTTLAELTAMALAFRDERDWKQFHNFKDQTLSLSLEAAELLEIGQWKNGTELEAHLEQHRDRIGEELSDILLWVLTIASDRSIDLDEAYRKKLAANAKKYPVAKSRGSSRKYTEL